MRTSRSIGVLPARMTSWQERRRCLRAPTGAPRIRAWDIQSRRTACARDAAKRLRRPLGANDSAATWPRVQVLQLPVDDMSFIDLWSANDGVPHAELLRARDADRRAASRLRDRAPRLCQLSDGAVRLSTGTLYALLERAIDEGLIIGWQALHRRWTHATRLHADAVRSQRTRGRSERASATQDGR